jgi:hypothetical protein
VQTARVVGDRVYILLLIGDGEGEEMLKEALDRRQNESAPR